MTPSVNQGKIIPPSHNKLENSDSPQVIMTPLISIANQWRVNINWWKRTPLKPLQYNSNCNIRRHLILFLEQQELKPFPKSRRNWRTSFWNENRSHASVRISIVPIFQAVTYILDVNVLWWFSTKRLSLIQSQSFLKNSSLQPIPDGCNISCIYFRHASGNSNLQLPTVS